MRRSSKQVTINNEHGSLSLSALTPPNAFAHKDLLFNACCSSDGTGGAA